MVDHGCASGSAHLGRRMADDHVLRDGSVVTLRRAEPADAAALHALYDDLERDDVRLRFFSATADIDRVLSGYSTPANVNVVATAGPRLVAHGMYAPLGGDRAEVAFTVAHDAQGRGVGTLLLQRLAGIACADGIATFVADVLPDNHRMIEMFRESGLQPVRSAAARARSRWSCPHRSRPRRSRATWSASGQRPSQACVTCSSRTASWSSVPRAAEGRSRASWCTTSSPRATPDHCISSTTTRTRCRARSAFRSVDEVPGPIELAVLAVPAAEVVGAARACAARRRARARRSRGRVRRGRARWRGAPGRAARRLPLERHAARRAELHGHPQQRSGGQARRDVRTATASAGPARAPDAERRPGPRRDGGGGAPWHRPERLPVRRQQGRRLRQRSPGVVGAGRGHRRRPAVRRVLRQPAPVREHRPAGRSHDPDRGGEGRTIEGRRARRGVPHRAAPRRVGRDRRRLVPPRRA